MYKSIRCTLPITCTDIRWIPQYILEGVYCKTLTFRSLARLYEETTLHPICLDFFDSLTFPCIPAKISFVKPSQWSFLIFTGRKTEQGERRISHNHDMLLNRTIPAPPPPPSHVSPDKVSAMLHRAISRRRWRNFSLALREIFYPFTHLVLHLIFPRPSPFIPPP